MATWSYEWWGWWKRRPNLGHVLGQAMAPTYLPNLANRLDKTPVPHERVLVVGIRGVQLVRGVRYLISPEDVQYEHGGVFFHLG